MEVVEKVRNRPTFTSTIDPELRGWLDSVKSKTKIPKAQLLDKAIKLLREHYIANGESIDFSEMRG